MPRSEVTRRIVATVSGAVATILVASFVIFAGLAAAPGDPVAQILGAKATDQARADMRHQLGLDQPLGSIDPAKLNVVGSSLALGHPFAATGGRIVATLAKLLKEKGGGRGLISVCTAGGMGVTAILER